MTKDGVWVWDADYSSEALLDWMWRSFPSCLDAACESILVAQAE